MLGAPGFKSASPLLRSLIVSSQSLSPQNGACSKHFSSRPFKKAGKSVTTLRCSVSSDLALAYMLDWIVASRAGMSSFKPAFRMVSFSPESLKNNSTYWGPLELLNCSPSDSNILAVLHVPWANLHPDGNTLELPVIELPPRAVILSHVSLHPHPGVLQVLLVRLTLCI